MAIPESQLETWSRQGTTDSATALYERIRNALQNDAALRNRNFEVFLQGSYRNSTNIRGDSDVDVVAMLTDTYMPEYGALDAYTRSVVEGRSNSATYTHADFRRDVLSAIRRAFPTHSRPPSWVSGRTPRRADRRSTGSVPRRETGT